MFGKIDHKKESAKYGGYSRKTENYFLSGLLECWFDGPLDQCFLIRLELFPIPVNWCITGCSIDYLLFGADMKATILFQVYLIKKNKSDYHCEFYPE